MNQIVSASPHIHTKDTTSRIMLDVIIALMPALIAAVINYGFRALLVTAVTVAAAVASEVLFNLACKKKIPIRDLSAVVTGLLLAFNFPVSLPLWQCVIGAAVAIVAVKGLFGGLGKNFANPAITARVVMLLAFSGTMTDWTYTGLISSSLLPAVTTSGSAAVDAVSSATPLALMSAGEHVNYLALLFGCHGGCIGETCILALILGFIYLLVRRVITWHTPVVYIGVVFLFSLILGKDALAQIMSGGLFLGAIFMATDYVTTPSTKWGKVIFGAGCGILTVLIRQFGSYAEGISFSILFMNILTPYITRWTEARPFGGAKA